MLLIGANLRPAITAVGPLVDQIGADLRPAVRRRSGCSARSRCSRSRWSHRWSINSAGGSAATGCWSPRRCCWPRPRCCARCRAAATSLWVGTILIGAFVAVGNVIVPAVIKRDFELEVPRVTGLYSAMLGGTSAFASGLALPVADAAGWRVALGFWAVLSVIAALVWLPRMRGRRTRRRPRPGRGRADQPDVDVTDRLAGHRSDGHPGDHLFHARHLAAVDRDRPRGRPGGGGLGDLRLPDRRAGRRRRGHLLHARPDRPSRCRCGHQRVPDRRRRGHAAWPRRCRCCGSCSPV